LVINALTVTYLYIDKRDLHKTPSYPPQIRNELFNYKNSEALKISRLLAIVGAVPRGMPVADDPWGNSAERRVNGTAYLYGLPIYSSEIRLKPRILTK
jgi:hypothetical protein